MAEQATSENRNKQLNWAIEMKMDVVIITRKREQKEGVLWREQKKLKYWHRQNTELLVKKLEPAQKTLAGIFTKSKDNNTNIPTWWPTGRTVLLPKTKNLEDEKN